MNLQLKALCFGLITIVATGAIAAVNASANVSGHFTHDATGGHATIVGTETSQLAHWLRFQRTSPTGTDNGLTFYCTSASYHGTLTSSTSTSLALVPNTGGCATFGDPAHGSVAMTTNGCSYVFSSHAGASMAPPVFHATFAFSCPAGKAIEIHHPNCGTKIPPQSLRGATYGTTVEGGKHSLTVVMTVTHITVHYHSGTCVFLGTNQLFDLQGSFTVKAFNTAGEQVGLTAT